MKTKHSIKYSFEKTMRIDDSGSILNQISFVIETPINIGAENCSILLSNIEKTLTYFKSNLNISYKTKSVKVNGSHEDPLIQDDGFNLICFQIPTEIIDTREIYVEVKADNEIIYEYLLDEKIKNNILDKNFTKFDLINNQIINTEESSLILHLTDLNGNYKEESVKKYNYKNPFNFSELIGKYNYIGIQFSYEKSNVETEEKYILVGQKSMKYSQILNLNNATKIYPIIYTNSIFCAQTSDKDFKEVLNLNNLIHYFELERPYLFEISFEFIKKNYLENPTYTQNKFFSSKKPNKLRTHLNLQSCKECRFKSYCLQVVPSGLTEELFKKNIGLDNEKLCKIYKIIDKTVQKF